jgi:hypothetical protein
LDAGPRWDDCEPLPDPCPRCGGMAVWWTLSGRPRCLRCDPPERSRGLAARADRVRRLAPGPVREARDIDAQPRFRRLVGVEFPPRPSTQPPAGIVADPVVMCPRCGAVRVLAELRRMTGGLCCGCHAETEITR